jgi:hypothetical protein
MNESILKEIESYDPDILGSLLLSQWIYEPFINKRCMNCQNHKCVIFNNRDIHICNDNFSGMNVGEHIFYGETRDMCAECHGFKRK